MPLLRILPFLCLSANLLAAEQQARISLNCLSLKFQTATLRQFFGTYTLELSTDPNSLAPNGELVLANQSIDTTHASFYRLTLPNEFEPIIDLFFLNVPIDDTDRNGLPDFFEVGRSVASTVTTGHFNDGLGGDGDLTATWARSAGAKNGTCRLQMVSDYYNLIFNITFEVIEMTGILKYQAAGTNVLANVALSQTGASSATLAGNLVLDRLNPNTLGLQPGTITNAAQEALSFTNSILSRINRTNYFGDLVFADGDPSTSIEDYFYWLVNVVDINDADGDGIPDLSDPVTPLVPPQLSIRRSGQGKLAFTITGQAGITYSLEQVPSLNSTNWMTVQSIPLTSATQSVTNDLPGQATAFWRLR